jgi:REP element-mobilizing transposase RayT
MANTYTQIYVHAVFAVEGRQSLIAPEHKIEIYKYMTTVVQNQKNKVMAINGMPDHVHLLIGLNPDIALSNLVRDAKAASSFRDEYEALLKKFDVEYDPAYLFTYIDDVS